MGLSTTLETGIVLLLIAVFVVVPLSLARTGGIGAFWRRPPRIDPCPPLDGAPDGDAARELLTVGTARLEVVRVSLDLLSRRDPAFSPDAVTAGAAAALKETFRGWEEQRPDGARRFLADSLFHAFCTQVEEWRSSERRNLVSPITLLASGVTGVAVAEDWVRVRVRLEVESQDCDVDASGDRVLRGQRDARRRWVQSWILRRAANVVTRADGGLLAGRCPVCGAAMQVDLDGRCGFCHTIVLDGTHDWVVVAFSGEAEEAALQTSLFGDWMPERSDFRDVVLPPGVDAIRARDPAFSVPAMVGAGRHAIIMLLDALQHGDVTTLEGWDESAVSAAASMLPGPGRRLVVSDVELPAAYISEAVSDAVTGDRVTVRVGVDCAMRAADEPAPAGGDAGSRTYGADVTLTRDRSVDAGTLRCPRCGGALPSAVSDHCAYCHAALTADAWGWRVTALTPLHPAIVEVPRRAAPAS